MKNNYVPLIIRLSLGIVFLTFGIEKFRNDIWVETIKGMDFFVRLPWDVNISVVIIGVIEVLTGLALIVGLFTRFFACLAAVQLTGILILLRFGETRDIGLLGMAISLVIIKDKSFCIDWLWRKSRGELT
jgi:uncharacterized membrane protein YphA (DoxX/SURF4 family)